MKNKKIWIFLILIITAGVVGKVFFSKEKTEEIQYLEIGLKKLDLVRTLSTTGVVKPKNRLEVKPPVAGRIEEIYVAEGDVVKKGQLLGKMSSTDRVALIDVAREDGEKELERWKNIYKATPLISAIDGTLIAREIEPGQTVTSSDILFVIADKLIINAQVDETDIAHIKINEKTMIKLDAYSNRSIPGVVEHVAYESTTVDNVTVYEVEVTPENAPDFMKSGMSADIIFDIESISDALTLPLRTIQYDINDQYVFVKTNKGKERRSITTGIESAGQIEIKSGLSESDIILTPDISFKKSKKDESTNPFMMKRPGRKKTTGRK